MEPCEPTPEQIKAGIVARLRAAAEELKQAQRAYPLLPSLSLQASLTERARREIESIADHLNPFG